MKNFTLNIWSLTFAIKPWTNLPATKTGKLGRNPIATPVNKNIVHDQKLLKNSLYVLKNILQIYTKLLSILNEFH